MSQSGMKFKIRLNFMGRQMNCVVLFAMSDHQIRAMKLEFAEIS